MNRKAPYIIILFLCIFSFCGLTSAEQLENKDLPNREGLKLDGIRLHSAFKASEELETNIFLADKDEKFDAITLLSPSVGLEAKLGDSRLSADYEMGIFLYGQYTTENHIDHRARALAEINLTDYKITVRDTFRDFTDRAVDENSRRIGRQYNELRAGIGAQFDQLGLDVGYTNLIETYSQKDDTFYQSVTYGDKDRIINAVDATVSYAIFPKTSLFLEGDLGFPHYYTSSLPPDSYFIDTFIGIKGRPTNKILVDLKGGFRYQNYDKSDVLNDKDYFGPIASGGLDYFFTKDDTVNFGVIKRLYESTYQNNNYYDLALVSLKYTHRFSRKISVTPYGYYQLSLYPTETTEDGVTAKRYDNLFCGGITARYDIRKWASVEFKYEYANRDSRFSAFNYADNRITFSGTVGF